MTSIPTDPDWPPASAALSFEAFQAILAGRPDLRVSDESINRRVAVERILVLAFGRAILLQYTHPLIAAAVAQHSYSTSSTADKSRRFKRTMALRMQMSFGTEHDAWLGAQQIDKVHGFIHGTARVEGRGELRYSARDPRLIRWVHATVVDSSLLVYDRFVRPLNRAQRDDYLRRASPFVPLLGGGMEPFCDSAEALDRYMAEMESSGELVVSGEARRLAAQVLEGLPLPIVGGIANAAGRLLIRELMPRWAASQYGMRSSRLGRSALALSTAGYRRIGGLLPRRWTKWATTFGAAERSLPTPQKAAGCPFSAPPGR